MAVGPGTLPAEAKEPPGPADGLCRRRAAAP